MPRAFRSCFPWPGWLHHRFTLMGLNLERFLNLLQKEGIVLLQVARVDRRSLHCVCRSTDLQRIAAIAAEKGWRMEGAKPVGAGAWLCRLLRRPGLLAGGVLACATLVLAMQFVWFIRIEEAGPYRADVAAYLAAEGYRPGLRRTRVDADRLALQLQRRYPEVAWFRVYVNNVTLTVECTPGVPAPPLPATGTGDVYAARGGIVQAVEVYAGTAVVRPGDVVLPGQLLLRGVEQGADGAQVPVAARGRVQARCWHQTTVRIPQQETLSRETGRSTSLWQVCTPWCAWPGQTQPPAYLTSQLTLTETPVVGCFFPVWLRRAEYRELALETALRPAEQVRAEAEAAARSRLHSQLRGQTLTGEWIRTTAEEGGYLCATATAEFVADLCQPAPAATPVP